MSLSNTWGVLVNSLGERRPQSSDEVRDAHAAQIKRDRLKAMKEGRYRQAVEQTAETEKKILKVVARLKLACIDDLKNELGMTAHHLRTVAMNMVTDGRLAIKVGTYGKKFWRINK